MVNTDVNDRAKSKDQLISELETTRQRVADLENRLQLLQASVAERQQARQERIRFTTFTHRLLEASPLGILYLNAAGCTTYENPAMRRIMGVPEGVESPVLRVPITQLPAIQEAGILPLLERCRKGETIVGQVVHYRSLMGKEVDLEIHAAPMLDEQGKWEGAIVMAHDITERLRVEEAIRQQTAQLAALREVGLELAAELNLDDLLHFIVSRAIALLGQNSGGLYLYQPDQDVLQWTVSVGSSRVPEGSTLHRGESLFGQVWKTGQPLIIHDFQYWESGGTLHAALPWKAIVGAPICWGEEFLGVVIVESETAGSFSVSDAELLSLFAGQAAIAIKNAHLHGETQRRLQEQSALREAGAAFSSALDLETVLTRIAEQMARIIDATSAYICSYDLNTMLSTTLAEYIGPEACDLEQESDLGVTYLDDDLEFLEDMRANKHNVSDLNDPNLSQTERAHMEQYGAKTILYVPLRIKDQLIGFAELWESRRRRTFTPEEIALCQGISQQAAVALENARLFEQAQQEILERKRAEERLRQRNRELTLLNRVIAATAAHQAIEPVLRAVCQELAQAFDTPQSAAAVFDSDQTEAVVVAEYLAKGRPPSVGETIPVEGNPSCQYLLEHKAPLAVDDAQTDPRLAPIHDLMRRRGTVSLLLVPLMIEGEVVGSLGVDAVEHRPFSADEITLAQRVAEQVSSTLARARLEQDQRRLEEQLRQAQKMEALGHMAGGVAHDFNNLLTVIHMSIQLLERSMHPEDPLWEHVHSIKDAGKRATDLTRRLLSFSRREMIKPQAINLNHIVGNLRPMLRRIAGESIELSTPLADDLWLIEVDPSQMDQVLVNLVVNACAAMPDGGTLTIETANVVIDQAYVATHVDASLGEHIELTISDTGVGMDDEVKAHLFEPFFTTKEPGQGTGLGLATVYGIVKQNHGHIRVYSEKRLGTTFRIYLPRATETVAPSRPDRPSIAISMQGTETILLAEDEPAVRTLAARILGDHGYLVLAAKDGLEALELSEQHEGPIHLLLTDLVMPNMNGRQLANRLLASRPDTQVLFMSGYTDRVVVRHGMLEPGIAFVSKPLTVEGLLRRVRAALDEYV